jgi:CMP-N-acetylneuraminic acid synthetase
MRILGLIPARGGSKGVPRKNIRPLNGRPLLQYTTEAALQSRRLSRVVLSTDDPEIAEVGKLCGISVPFLRPPELARDDTPTLPVIQHAIRQLEPADGPYDAVCLLQPTHPLRRAEQIDACIDLLESSGADAVVTLLPVPAHYNPHWVYFSGPGGDLRLATGEDAPIPRRQDLPRAYHREGSIYVTRRSVLMEGNSLYGRKVRGCLMDPESTVNIDSLADWDRAAEMLTRQAAPPKISEQGNTIELESAAPVRG